MKKSAVNLKRACAFALSLSVVIPTSSASGQFNPVPPATAASLPQHLSAQAWQDDVTALATQLPKLHTNAFFKIKAEDFQQAANKLVDEIPALADAQVALRIAQLVAMIGDSHTQAFIDFRRWSIQPLPIEVLSFSDGLFIIQATPDLRDLLGARITAIGAARIDDAIKKVGTFFAYENESLLKNNLPIWITRAQALRTAELTDNADLVTLAIHDVQGQDRLVQLQPNPAGRNTLMLSLPEVTAQTVTPLSWQQRAQIFWFDFMPDFKTVYCRYDHCADDKNESVAQFADRLLKFIDRNGVQKLIVDLRRNGGGDSGLLRPLINGIKARQAINQKGRLVVLIGRTTFSSAMMNADELRHETNALLYGEPTGGKPNSFGEVKSFNLPNSGIKIQYSTKYWRMEEADPPSLMPDVKIEMASTDYFAIKDPVLDAALAAKSAGP